MGSTIVECGVLGDVLTGSGKLGRSGVVPASGRRGEAADDRLCRGNPLRRSAHGPDQPGLFSANTSSKAYASGCDPDGEIGEDHAPETHLIPRILMAVTGEAESITVFGTDYPTPDGTCIRDYIHVLDLARAHALALDHLRNGKGSTAVNLGTGNGFSVKDIISTAEAVTGKSVPVSYGPRRAGDPAELVANPAKAKEVLGWEAEFKDPRSHIQHAWNWMTGPRKGRYAK